MPLTQTDILRKAELLAGNLAGGPAQVKKNALLAVVADFMSDPKPDLDRLRRTMRLLKQGSGGHLKRGGGFGDQVKAVADELDRLMQQEGLTPGEYKSLFGWTARLLVVRGIGRQERVQARQRKEHPSFPSRDEGKRTLEKAPAAAPGKLGAVNQKGLSVLDKFKQQLLEREGKEKS